MRTPHLRTNLSAAEVADTLREALREISNLSKRLQEEKDAYSRLLALWHEEHAAAISARVEVKALNEQIINQSRTIERYQREVGKS